MGSFNWFNANLSVFIRSKELSIIYTIRSWYLFLPLFASIRGAECQDDESIIPTPYLSSYAQSWANSRAPHALSLTHQEC